MANNNTAIQKMILSGVIGWDFDEVLEVMISVVYNELSPLDRNLLGLARYSFGLVELKLRSMRGNPIAPLRKDQDLAEIKDELDRSIDYLDNIEQVKVLCLAGLCCDLMKDGLGRRNYYEEARNVLRVVIKKCEDSSMQEQNASNKVSISFLAAPKVLALIMSDHPVGAIVAVAGWFGASLWGMRELFFSYQEDELEQLKILDKNLLAGMQ